MVCEKSGTFSNINPFTHRHQVLQEMRALRMKYRCQTLGKVYIN